MFADTGVIQKVDHVSVDVWQVFEGHESPEPGGTGSFMKLDEDLFFGECGGPQLHFVLLQDLVNQGALDCWEQQLLHHQHGKKHCTCPHDVWKWTAFLGGVLSQSLKELMECYLYLLRKPHLSGFYAQQTGHFLDFG